MKVVARRTGLSAHLIRIWERRYDAVRPTRNDTNRRRYSDKDVARLLLLQAATRVGHSIGQIAKLPEATLRELLNQDGVMGAAAKGARRAPAFNFIPGGRDFLAESLAAVKRLDALALETSLRRAALEWCHIGLLQCVLVPLIQQIGNGWQEGVLKIAHEHIATAVIRTFLGSLARAYALPANAPHLLVGTPRGQWHELGALLVAAAASNQGWRVTYLGPCLPAEEIAGVAIQGHVQAVALSLVYPDDDPSLESELVRLRQLLPAKVIVLVGGRAAPAYGKWLEEIRAHQLRDLPDLQAKLEVLRHGRL